MTQIWIIGASSGIGYELAKTLAAEGKELVLSARNEAALKKLAKELPGKHQILPLDVSDEKAVMQAVKKIKDLSSVIFLAAIYKPGSIAQMDMENMRQMMAINMMGAFYVTAAVLPLFREKRAGQIVLGGSVAGYSGLPSSQPYGATKAAIINFAETLRAEASRYNIDVKVINPGFVKTPMTDKNSFAMPMIVTAEYAAQAIAKGLKKKAFEIHFPKRFTYILKCLGILPYALFFAVVKRIKT